MTIIDMHTNTFVNSIPVANSPTPTGPLAQSHTTSFDPENSGVFYTAAAAEENYVEVDAVSGAVTRTQLLDPGLGYIIQT